MRDGAGPLFARRAFRATFQGPELKHSQPSPLETRHCRREANAESGSEQRFSTAYINWGQEAGKGPQVSGVMFHRTPRQSTLRQGYGGSSQRG